MQQAPSAGGHQVRVFIAFCLLAGVIGALWSWHHDALLWQILIWPATFTPILGAVLLTWSARDWKAVRTLLAGLIAGLLTYAESFLQPRGLEMQAEVGAGEAYVAL